MGEQIHICSDSQAALWVLEASRVMPKLVWECRQAICVLFNQNKVPLLLVPVQNGIRGNADAEDLARKGISS
jgi:hypothetical protein